MSNLDGVVVFFPVDIPKTALGSVQLVGPEEVSRTFITPVFRPYWNVIQGVPALGLCCINHF